MIAKIHYHSEKYRHSENCTFRYAQYFSLCTILFAMIAKIRYHSEITQRSEISNTVPLATVPTAPYFLFLLFSALLSSWSLIYDVEFDSNSSCLDRLNNVGMISSQKLKNLPQNAISRIIGTLMCKSG